jgi:hypothetical protein
MGAGDKLSLGKAGSAAPKAAFTAPGAGAVLNGFVGALAYPGGPIVSITPSFSSLCASPERVAYDSAGSGLKVVSLSAWYDAGAKAIASVEQELSDGTVFTIGAKRGVRQSERWRGPPQATYLCLHPQRACARAPSHSLTCAPASPPRACAPL